MFVETVEKLDAEKQESIPVGCVLPAWKPYVRQFQWPPSDVTGGPK